MKRLENKKIYSTIMDYEFNLRIYLPKDYNDSKEAFKVIYMHDGQNLFESENAAYGVPWKVDEVIDEYTNKTNENYIIVGIDNPGMERYSFYSPWKYEDKYPEIGQRVGFDESLGGRGNEYGEFIANELLPYINSSYKVLEGPEHTTILGSSMGGIISLYVGISYPEFFGRVGALSTAVWFDETDLLKYARNASEGLKIYSDIGTNETSGGVIKSFPEIYLYGAIALNESLLASSINEENLKFVIDEGGEHNEETWNKRLPEIFDWLLK